MYISFVDVLTTLAVAITAKVFLTNNNVVVNLLQFRFGSLDNELQAIIEPLLTLPPEKFTPLLMQLPREKLIARFGKY